MKECGKPHILLFTNSFPYDDQYTEIPFLQNEISVLAKVFNIHIVPTRDEGKKYKVDNAIKIFNGLAQDLRKGRSKSLIIKIIKSIKYNIFFKELTKCKKIGNVKNLVTNTNDIDTVFKWANNNRYFFKKKELIIYTYWSTAITSGLIYFRKKNQLDFKIVSRAHGADLYIERKGFIPYYYHRLKHLDKLFLISQAGRKYLVNKYPELSNKYYVSSLGTKKTCASLARKTNNTILIISCSAINSIKRVNIIYKSILLLARRNVTVQFKWVHLGGGPLKNDLKQMIHKENSNNLTVDIKGILSNKEIHSFYKDNFVNCFVHASESEGLPLSFMEAQSYGIPIISTNVGGVSEIVNNKNGILIDAKADINEMADAIKKIVFAQDLREVLSKNAFNNWETNFNAEKNYSKFLNLLTNL